MPWICVHTQIFQSITYLTSQWQPADDMSCFLPLVTWSRISARSHLKFSAFRWPRTTHTHTPYICVLSIDRNLHTNPQAMSLRETLFVKFKKNCWMHCKPPKKFIKSPSRKIQALSICMLVFNAHRILRKGKRYDMLASNRNSETNNYETSDFPNAYRDNTGSDSEAGFLTKREVEEQIMTYIAPLTKQLEDLIWLIEGMLSVHRQNLSPKASTTASSSVNRFLARLACFMKQIKQNL